MSDGNIWGLISNTQAYDLGCDFARFVRRYSLITFIFFEDSKFMSQNEIAKVVDDDKLHDVLDYHEIINISESYLSHESMIRIYFPYSKERITNFLVSNSKVTANKRILADFGDSMQPLDDYLYDFITAYDDENFLTVFDSIMYSVFKHKMGIADMNQPIYSFDSDRKLIVKLYKEPIYNASDFQPVIRVNHNILKMFHKNILSKIKRADRILRISSIMNFMEGLYDSHGSVGNRYFRNVDTIISNLIYSPIKSEDLIQYNLRYFNNIDYI